MGILEHKGFMPPQYLMVIDTILTMPGTTLEVEYQRRINMINVVTAFCDVEEGQPTLRLTQSHCRPVPDGDNSCSPAKQQQHPVEDKTKITLRHVMESVWIKSPEEQHKICFLCVGNPNLLLKDGLVEYATSGSLTRHFLRKHVKPHWPAKGVECNVYGREPLQQKVNLLDYAEAAHGTVM